MLKQFIRDWLVPPRIWRLMGSLRGTQEYISRTSKDMLSFKNCHQGQRCFILATGPSINSMDLTCLHDEICMAVSLFGYHKDIEAIRPCYHFAAPLHQPLQDDEALKYFKMFKERYTWPVDVFLSINGYEYSFDRMANKYPEWKPDRVHFIDYGSTGNLAEENRDDAKIWDVFLHPYGMRTSVAGALMLCDYMGFSEVCLLGCDFNYMRDLAGNTNRHFYSDDNALEKRINYLENSKMLEKFLQGAGILWKQYRLIEEHYRSEGRIIYNASPDSSLNMFEKVDFSAYVSNKGEKKR